jgi:hypothetical protein
MTRLMGSSNFPIKSHKNSRETVLPKRPMTGIQRRPRENNEEPFIFQDNKNQNSYANLEVQVRNA